MFSLTAILSITVLMFSGCAQITGGVGAAQTDNPALSRAVNNQQAFKKQLNITEEQKAALRSLIQESFPELESLYIRLQDKGEALVSALIKENYSESDVRTAVKRLAPVISDIALKASELVMQIREKDILSEEQVRMIREHRRERDSRVDSFLAGKHGGNGKHGFGNRTDTQKIIDLSFSQRMEITSILLENKPAFLTIIQTAVPAARSLRDAVCADEPSQKNIRISAEVFCGELEKAAVLAGSVIQKIRPALTSEQITELEKAQKSFAKVRRQLSNEALRKFRKKLEESE